MKTVWSRDVTIQEGVFNKITPENDPKLPEEAIFDLSQPNSDNFLNGNLGQVLGPEQ